MIHIVLWRFRPGVGADEAAAVLDEVEAMATRIDGVHRVQRAENLAAGRPAGQGYGCCTVFDLDEEALARWQADADHLAWGARNVAGDGALVEALLVLDLAAL